MRGLCMAYRQMFSLNIIAKTPFSRKDYSYINYPDDRIL